MKLVAYTRVSTDAQAERGLGLDVQEHAIKQWAKTNGHKIVVWAQDAGASGSNGLDSRVGLYDAFAALKARQADGFVVYRLDRLARDLILQESLLAELWRLGIEVHSTQGGEAAYLQDDPSDPSRTLIRQILGAVAQYERSLIRLRMAGGKARKKAAGGYLGGPTPLGWKVERGELVPDDDEQQVRERIVALRAEGLSLRQICGALEADGLRTKRGGKWAPQTVALVLERSA